MKAFLLLVVLVVLVVSALACAPDVSQSACEPGRSIACVCSSGATGAQECGAAGVWGACVCAAPSDAGSDAAAAADARTDAADAADARRDADPRCVRFATETTWCEAGDAGACVDLQRDPRNCGRCGRGCDNVRSECFDGECFVPFPDAGRD